MPSLLTLYQVEVKERNGQRTMIWPDGSPARLRTLDEANQRLMMYVGKAQRGEPIEGNEPRSVTDLFVTEVEVDANEERLGYDVRSTKDIRHERVERVDATSAVGAAA
ncbi:MAG: hypothetical protein IPM54_24930 [Polyangiaceae bacterium]|nr:hypothetical protein [Polyangiaceae bacterium]